MSNIVVSDLNVKFDKYLTQGEAIEKTFTLKGYDIHATNKRLFVSTLTEG